MKKTGFVALCALLIAGCGQSEDAVGPVAQAALPQAETVDVLAGLGPLELKAKAFKAAWGQDGSYVFKPAKDGERMQQTYSSSALVSIGQDLYALISEGKGQDDKHVGGSLGIHYLKRTPAGFEKVGSWPAFHTGGQWGATPEWTLRADLMPWISIQATDGYGMMNGSCQVAYIIELTDEKPVLRMDRVMTYHHEMSYVDGEDLETRWEGYLVADKPGRTVKMRMTDTDEVREYRKQGDKYVDPNAGDRFNC